MKVGRYRVGELMLRLGGGFKGKSTDRIVCATTTGRLTVDT